MTLIVVPGHVHRSLVLGWSYWNPHLPTICIKVGYCSFCIPWRELTERFSVGKAEHIDYDTILCATQLSPVVEEDPQQQQMEIAEEGSQVEVPLLQSGDVESKRWRLPAQEKQRLILLMNREKEIEHEEESQAKEEEEEEQEKVEKEVAPVLSGNFTVCMFKFDFLIN